MLHNKNKQVDQTEDGRTNSELNPGVAGKTQTA